MLNLIDRPPAPGIQEDVPTVAQVDELRTAVALLTGGLAETPRSKIAALVGRLANAYRAEKLTAREAAGRLATYQDLLCDIPPDLLALAFRRAGQRCTFFPTVAEIRQQVGLEMATRHWRLFRAQYLIQHHERNWRPAQPAISEAERAEVAAGLARLGRALSVLPNMSAATAADREERRAAILASMERETGVDSGGADRVAREMSRPSKPPVDM